MWPFRGQDPGSNPGGSIYTFEVMKINKAKLNYWIDFLAFISFLIVGFSGIVKYYFLPMGKGSFDSAFWGISKHAWTVWHDISGIIFVGLIIIHIVLHWAWIVSMTKRIFKK